MKPRRRANGKRRTAARGPKQPRTLTVQGPWGIGLSLPIAKLPIKIGSDKDLNANQSVYPVLHGLSIPISLSFGTIALGAISQVVNVNFALINAWATRFAATFDEYCITGFKFELRVQQLGGLGQGLVYAYLDEKDSGAPTATVAQSSPRLDIMINNAALPIRHELSWLARDLSDLSWTSTATSVTPVYLKFFASNADTGTANDTSAVVYLTGALNVDFRGYKN